MTRTELLAIAKPILFNTDMVRAVLDGRKTATRRVVKPQPELKGRLWTLGGAKWSDGVESVCPMIGHSLYNRIPYKPDDYLYVRETWAKNAYGGFFYKSDGKCEVFSWRPSIHMPKEAARLFLRVTDVRVERLQDIPTLDILHEGIVDKECDKCREETGGCYPQKDVDVFCGREEILSDKYADLWESTVKKQSLDRYGWDANPWVWVIEFERVNVDAR